MNESMYPDSAMDDNASPSHGDPDNDPKKDEEEQSGGESALIPKSLLDGKDFKVGDTISLKILHEYEDEVEVEYAKEGDEQSNSEGMRDSDGDTMKESMGSMSSFGSE